MSNHYSQVAAGLCLYFTGFSIAAAQTGPEFLECTVEPIRLCVQDEGVRLPVSNQIYAGDLNPDASRCSVHLRRSIVVKSTCGTSLQYEVRLHTSDTSAAIILQPPTFIFTDSSSNAEIFFDTENATDEIIRANGLSYSSGCIDVHRIEWIVTDSCGQENRCEQFFELYDCAPVLVQPKSDITILGFNYSYVVSVVARDFVLSAIDDCSMRGELLYSFSETSYRPDSIISCDYIPAFGVELPLDIWIAGDGVDANCDGNIAWTERRKFVIQVSIVYKDLVGSLHCGFYPMILLSGIIQTEVLAPIAEVTIEFTSPGYVFPPYVTTENGRYALQRESFPNPFTITPSKNDSHKNGVSTLDAIKIQRHLLGHAIMTNPPDLIAADINNSMNVSAIDVVELRKIILGIYTVFPNNKSWRFVPKKFIFQDTHNPWPYSESLTLNIFDDVTDADFIGIKIGDVNNSSKTGYNDTDHQSTYPEISFRTDDKVYLPNEKIEIPISFHSEASLLGFQFTLSSHDLQFELVDYPDGNPFFVGYAIFDDEATFSVMQPTTEPIMPGEIIFSVLARALRHGSLSRSLTINSNITEAEAYNTNEEILKPVLQFYGRGRHQMAENPASHPRNNEATHTPVLVGDHIQVDNLFTFPMQPNPWKESSVLTFFLQEESAITFTSYDASGRKIYAFEKPYRAGYNEIVLSKEDFPQEGIYFFNLQSGQASTAGKFVVLK